MKRIAILIETSLASGRGIVHGITKFLDERNDWSVFQHSGPLGALAPEALQQWDGDGIIARIANQDLLELIQSKGLPTVDVLGNIRTTQFPIIKCHDEAIGTTVAQHFISNGHTRFGFVGLSDENWSLERERGFRHTAKQRFEHINCYHIKQNSLNDDSSQISFDALKTWLAKLETPIALMVASDQLAPIIFEACHQLELSIPENVSVVGVDNDSPFCNLCRPRLSSVEPNHAKVGYVAAQTLEQLMAGNALESPIAEVALHTLHERPSSDLISIKDTTVIRALHYMRKHACEGTNIDSVAKAAGLSRSVLQRRLRQQLNRSVGDIILAEKLRVAQEMLFNTTLSIAQVAERSGFSSQEYLNYIFKKHLKTTPRKFRLR